MDEQVKQQILEALGKSDYSEVIIKLLESDSSLKNRVMSIYNTAIDTLKNKASELTFDTKKINDELTKNLADGLTLSKKQKNEIANVYKGITNHIKKYEEGMTSQTSVGGVDLGSILGQTPRMGMLSKLSFAQLRLKLLSKLKLYVNNLNPVNQDKMLKGNIDIASILGQTPRMGILSRTSFKFLRFKLLGKLKTYVDSIKSDSIKGGLDIGSILGQTPSMGTFSRLSFAQLRFKILGKLKTYVDNIKSDSIKGDIDIGTILGQTPSMGIFSRLSFAQLRFKLIGKLKDYVDNLNNSEAIKGGITIDSIFGETPKMGLLTRLRYNRLRRKLIKKLEDQIDGKESKGGVLGGIFGKVKDTLGIGGNKKEEVFAKEKPEVVVTDLGRDARKFVKGLFKEKDDKQPEKKKVPGWLAAILLGLGGVVSLISGLFDKGPFKGIKKLIGKVGIFAALKVASKLLTKKLSISVLKAIPVIGTAVGIGFGISRFMQGDFAGGLIEFAGALVDLIPGVGPILSLGIDAILAWRDIKGGGPEKLKNSGFNMAWKDKFIPFLAKMPLFDTIIALSKSIGFFMGGDWKAGLMELSMVLPGTKLLLTLMGIDTEKLSNNVSQIGFKKTFENMGRKMSRNLIKALFPKSLEGVVLKAMGLNEPGDKIEDFSEAGTAQPDSKSKTIIKDMGKGLGKGLFKLITGTELPSTNPQKANDFIWRPGKNPELLNFSKQDTVFGKKIGSSGESKSTGHADIDLAETNLYLQAMIKGIERLEFGIKELSKVTKQTAQNLGDHGRMGENNPGINDNIRSYSTWSADRIHEYHVDVWKAIKEW